MNEFNWIDRINNKIPSFYDAENYYLGYFNLKGKWATLFIVKVQYIWRLHRNSSLEKTFFGLVCKQISDWLRFIRIKFLSEIFARVIFWWRLSFRASILDEFKYVEIKSKRGRYLKSTWKNFRFLFKVIFPIQTCV